MCRLCELEVRRPRRRVFRPLAHSYVHGGATNFAGT